MVMDKRNIQDTFPQQRPPSASPPNLPDCLLSEIHEPATYAEAVKSPQAPFGEV